MTHPNEHSPSRFLYSSTNGSIFAIDRTNCNWSPFPLLLVIDLWRGRPLAIWHLLPSLYTGTRLQHDHFYLITSNKSKFGSWRVPLQLSPFSRKNLPFRSMKVLQRKKDCAIVFYALHCIFPESLQPILFSIVLCSFQVHPDRISRSSLAKPLNISTLNCT